MKLLKITVKGLRETTRDRKSFLFLMLFPVMFILIFRIAFGWGAAQNETYTIAVLDLDTGQGPWDSHEPTWLSYANILMGTSFNATTFFDTVALNGSRTAGEQFTDHVLRTAMYEDGKTHLFEVKVIHDLKKGEDMVRNEEVAVVVIIPANFTSAIQGVADKAVVGELRAHSIVTGNPMPGYANATVELMGTQGTMKYSFASAMTQGYLGAYTGMEEAIVRQTVGSRLSGGPAPREGPAFSTEFVDRGKTSEFVAFDWIAPGIIVFGLMMTTMGVATGLVSEVKDRTLNRLKLTKMSAVDMMGGATLQWLVIGVLQTLLIFVVALAVGTHFAGDYLVAVPIAILIGVVVVLASIALGLIISSFVDDPEQASNLGTLIVVPLSFFTGVYFNMDLSATRYLPWTQGATAMRQALLFNNWGTAMAATLICLLGAGVMFVMGVLLFKYKRLGGG